MAENIQYTQLNEMLIRIQGAYELITWFIVEYFEMELTISFNAELRIVTNYFQYQSTLTAQSLKIVA